VCVFLSLSPSFALSLPFPTLSLFSLFHLFVSSSVFVFFLESSVLGCRKKLGDLASLVQRFVRLGFPSLVVVIVLWDSSDGFRVLTWVGLGLRGRLNGRSTDWIV